MKDAIISKCLAILRREDVKKELKELLRPIVDIILQELYPYIYLSMLFVITSFLLILAIFILLLCNDKTIMSKIKNNY